MPVELLAAFKAISGHLYSRMASPQKEAFRFVMLYTTVIRSLLYNSQLIDISRASLEAVFQLALEVFCFPQMPALFLHLSYQSFFTTWVFPIQRT